MSTSKTARRRAASGPAAVRFRPPLPDLRRHLRGVVRTRRAGHRCRAGDPGDQPPASPRPRASPSHLCGSRLRGHPRFARPSHPALGRRRPHRAGQPRAGVSVPPSAASSGRHHHHRTRRPARRHRQRGTTTAARDRSPVHRPNPHRPCRPIEDPSANAPTGGGTNPSNPNHHPRTTSAKPTQVRPFTA